MFSLVAGRTTLGSEGTDIPLQGHGIAAQHCYIENQAGSITLHPCGNQCSVDGLPITKPYRLSQGSTATGLNDYYNMIVGVKVVFFSNYLISIDLYNLTTIGAQRMNPNDNYPLTFHLVQPAGQSFTFPVKYLIHGPQRMNPGDFGDFLTFPLVLPGSHLQSK